VLLAIAVDRHASEAGEEGRLRLLLLLLLLLPAENLSVVRLAGSDG
jgi:hypothetical protein